MIPTACITKVPHLHTVLCACAALIFLCHMGGGGGGGGGDDVTTHVRGKHHKDMATSKSVASFQFRLY